METPDHDRPTRRMSASEDLLSIKSFSSRKTYLRVFREVWLHDVLKGRHLTLVLRHGYHEVALYGVAR